MSRCFENTNSCKFAGVLVQTVSDEGFNLAFTALPTLYPIRLQTDHISGSVSKSAHKNVQHHDSAVLKRV